MTIYIDVVLIENLVMNYIIIYATAIVLKTKKKHLRFFLASLLGAVYSIIAYISTLKIYSSLIVKFILSIIIVYIAYNPQKVKELWKDILIFYLISFVFGGAAFSLIYIVKPQDILMKNGLFLGTYPLKTIILGAIVAFVLIVVTFKVIKTKFSKKDMYCELIISLNGKKIKTKAMIDSGNFLREPITNTPVIVVESSLLYECIPKEILNNLSGILGGDFDGIPVEIRNEYLPKLKFISFSSLGKQNGMLVGIRPEWVIMELDEESRIKKDNVIVGIYDRSLTKHGEYRALVGMELVG